MALVDLSVPLEPSVKADLEAEARLSNQTPAEVAEEAIAQYLSGRKLKREAIRQALKEADDGVFISEAAVLRWVESWGTADELPSPEPDVFPR
ncbi:CopG family ribbon-helix-helix protein [Jiella avicenniae]|uniref:CopG family transcriptional regulator n=1 Tax=Jiella avicenniae TaxID=2907202 RepID=A0A9X1P3E9_9HYPH|nr:hypothetical protein [Jiella avicenniae]MCE7029029.1 hypothetical protein [Jiella avicenniae]